jgi:hypothetical protein
MKPSVIGHHTPAPLVWSAVARTARLAIFGFIGWFWFLSRNGPAGKVVPLFAVLVLAALVGITWYASRVLADRRWRAALDRYATRELVKGVHLRRNSRSRPNSTAG